MLRGKTWSRSVLLPLICVLLPAMAHASSPPSTQAPDAPQAAVTHPLFDFHSNFWVNLDQVLVHEACLRAGKPNRMLENAAPLSATGMSKQEAADWNAAVSFYAAHYGTNPPYTPPYKVDELIDVNDALAGQPDDGAHLDTKSLPAELIPVLQSAAVVYRKYWWPDHNKSNEDWLASQKDRVRDLGPKLAAAMTKDLHQPWDATPVRVDISYYVVALGNAMTTLGPSHITYSSFDPSHKDINGFELLFHESSHTYADTVMHALAAEGGTQHKDVADLWHATLFYTSGVELHRVLPAPEQASFTPYAYRYGVYRGRWVPYQHILETDWQAYLDGKTSFEAAIQSMVTDLPQ